MQTHEFILYFNKRYFYGSLNRMKLDHEVKYYPYSEYGIHRRKPLKVKTKLRL